MEKSEKVFEVESVPAEMKKMGNIIMQLVSVEVEVVGVEEPTIVASGLKKQDILIWDSTGTARLPVWEKEVGRMEKDGSYWLGGLMVREFCRKKFLSTSKQSSMIEKVKVTSANLVKSIAQKPAEDMTTAVLLKAAAFDVVHRDGIVLSITRKA